MTTPRVSFVVPAYNYAQYVAHAIRTLLNQTYRDLEIIVIDDASSDRTPEILEAFRGEGRVRLIRHATNRGHIRTYNEGLALARGEFIGLLSADDLCLRRDAVARQVAIFDTDPRVAFVYSTLTFVDASNRVLDVYPRPGGDALRDGIDEFRDLVFGNHVPASGTLARATCHRQLGYYDVGLPHTADWDLWLRFAIGHRVGYVSDSLYGYRRHGDNMHRVVVIPRRAVDDQVVSLDRAFNTLPASATPALRRLRRPALRAVARRGVDVERQWRSIGPGWRRAGRALAQYPELLVSPAFALSVTKLAVVTLFGARTAARLAGLRRSRLLHRVAFRRDEVVP